MAAQYELPPWIDKLSIEDAVKLILLGFFGTSAPSSGGSGSSSLTAKSATYNGTGAVSASSNNTSVQIGPTVTIARKIDIVNPASGGIWVNRGTAAGVNLGYYLAQYGVLSVDEPTTDAFFFISPSGAQTCNYIPRTAA